MKTYGASDLSVWGNSELIEQILKLQKELEKQ